MSFFGHSPLDWAASCTDSQVPPGGLLVGAGAWLWRGQEAAEVASEDAAGAGRRASEAASSLDMDGLLKPKLVIDPTIEDYYAFRPEHLTLEHYRHGESIGRIPVAI